MKNNMQKQTIDMSKVPTKSKKIAEKIQERMKKEKEGKKEGLDLRVFIKDLVDRKFNTKEEKTPEI